MKKNPEYVYVAGKGKIAGVDWRPIPSLELSDKLTLVALKRNVDKGIIKLRNQKEEEPKS